MNPQKKVPKTIKYTRAKEEMESEECSREEQLAK